MVAYRAHHSSLYIGVGYRAKDNFVHAKGERSADTEWIVGKYTIRFRLACVYN